MASTALDVLWRELGEAELFHGLSPAALKAIAAAARIRRLPKAAAVFNQGDSGSRAHVVLAGGVRILQTGADGEQTLIRFIKPGETFGTMALFTDRSYPAEATAAVDTVDASWSETELTEWMAAHPQIAMNLVRIAGKRLQEAQERIRELSTQRVERRVANALLRLARQASASTAGGTTIGFPLRRKDVADIAGTTLYMASRILTAWEKAGILVSQNLQLTICNPAAVSRIADGHPE